MKDAAVFSCLVATALHSLSLRQSLSTLFRLRVIQSGQAAGASLLRVGMAGAAPRSRICWRNSWLL